MERKSTESIEAALSLLEEAAEEAQDELRTAMADKYTHLRKLVTETECGLMKSLAAAKEHAFEASAHAGEAGMEKAREIARGVDQVAHQNPWPYIAGSAAAGVLLGAILGRSR